MKIITLIIDDDADSRLIIRTCVEEKYPNLFIAAEGASVKDAATLINKFKPDLVLLDIEMPDGTAFNLLEQLPEKNFEVIFITAFNTYAVKAFKLAAIDYLLKPVAYAEFDDAINRLESRMEEKYFTRHWMPFFYNSKQPDHNEKKLAIATGEGFLFVGLKEIVRLEAHSNYTYFYFKNGKKLVSSRTLGYYEEALPGEMFCRIHHAHMVNIAYVERYIKSGAGGTVVMHDEMELPVSQRKKDDVLKLLMKGTE